ncbi:MAG: sulfide/dihydroorotate dehydrogenase-like FAD/NAD-binding protein, partial [Planctomycetaceae bacterium]|nr:sulfide/dihydroorotate dehydrogenase-like FAD/NAD-binding protein [Planctomycetaceae bacterium]
MFRILNSTTLAPAIRRLEVEAPRIAAKFQAGQFVIVRVHEHGERIPLTIAAADPQQCTITLIVQGIGKTTQLINTLEPGQYLLDVVGPLGNPSEIRTFGTVVVIGGGVGSAIAWPIMKALQHAGNRVLAIIGARTRELIILESEVRAASTELAICTDDGSMGHAGVVTDVLRNWIPCEP